MNRPYLRTPSYQDPGGVPDTIQIAQNYYNQLVACPLHTYIITALIAAHWSVNNAPGAPVQPPGQPAPAAFPDFFPPNYNMVSAQGVPALTAAERSAFLGFTVAKTVVNNELAVTITLPRPANPTFLRAVQAVQLTHPQFDDDLHNVALDMYRRHFNNWIWRSLHTFKKDDAFLDAFHYGDLPALIPDPLNPNGPHIQPPVPVGDGQPFSYLSEPFRQPNGDLGMEPMLEGGYRLYSTQAQVQYDAPLVLVDQALVQPFPQQPPQILTEPFSILMDHTKMTEDANARTVILEFGSFTNRMEDGSVVPPPAQGLVQAGYAATAPYTEINVVMGDDERDYLPGGPEYRFLQQQVSR